MGFLEYKKFRRLGKFSEVVVNLVVPVLAAVQDDFGTNIQSLAVLVVYIALKIWAWYIDQFHFEDGLSHRINFLKIAMIVISGGSLGLCVYKLIANPNDDLSRKINMSVQIMTISVLALTQIDTYLVQRLKRRAMDGGKNIEMTMRGTEEEHRKEIERLNKIIRNLEEKCKRANLNTDDVQSALGMSTENSGSSYMISP